MKRNIIIILSVALFCATLYYLANRTKEDKFKKSEPAKREVIDWGEPDNTIKDPNRRGLYKPAKDPLEGLDPATKEKIIQDALDKYEKYHQGN